MPSDESDTAGAQHLRQFVSWPRVAAAFTLVPLFLLLLPGLWHQTRIVKVLDHTDFWQPFFYLSLSVRTYLQVVLPFTLVFGVPVHLILVRKCWLRWWHYLFGGVAATFVACVLVAVLDPWRGTFAIALFSPLIGATLGICIWCVLAWHQRFLIVVAGCLVLWCVALGLLQGRFGAIPSNRFTDKLVEMNFAGEHLKIPRNFIDSTWHDGRQGFISVTLGFTLPDLQPMTHKIAARIIPPRSLMAPIQRPDPQQYLKIYLRDAGSGSFSQSTGDRLKNFEIAGNLWAFYALELGQPPLSRQLDRRIQSILKSFVVEN